MEGMREGDREEGDKGKNGGKEGRSREEREIDKGRE